jgi:hypothetical protein
MGFYNPVQARLRRDLKAHRQFGLPKHSPVLLQLSVQIRVIGGSKNDFAKMERREPHAGPFAEQVSDVFFTKPWKR